MGVGAAVVRADGLALDSMWVAPTHPIKTPVYSHHPKSYQYYGYDHRGRWCSSKALDLYLGAHRFEFRSGQCLFWRQLFVYFLTPSNKTQG
jgi:hypothetical protein